MEQVIIERTHPDAKMPTKATAESACWDVYATHEALLEWGKIVIVDLGFKVKIPKGYEIVIRPRSGLAFNHGITIINSPGTIDSDYCGPMKVALSSLNQEHYEWADTMNKYGDYRYRVKKGDRIAQITLKKLESYEFVEGKVNDDTERGLNGFGSSGS